MAAVPLVAAMLPAWRAAPPAPSDLKWLVGDGLPHRLGMGSEATVEAGAPWFVNGQ